MQERSQRGRQLLGTLHVQARGLALDKSHDIARTEACERDAVPAEPIGQEVVNEPHVGGDGRLREHALMA